MFLKAVFIRFFRSFNFDFLRKHHPDAVPSPWEHIAGAWFPFVRVPLAKEITTIVGANESGKSHLLTAIEKGLDGEGITRRDFCRYSTFFTVEQGQMRSPDFGFHFFDLNTQEKEALRSAIEIKSPLPLDEYILIRSNLKELTVWLRQGDGYLEHKVINSSAFKKGGLLPTIYHIDSSIALPASVPISWLRGGTRTPWFRQQRVRAVEAVDKHRAFFKTEESIQKNIKQLHTTFSTFADDPPQGSDLTTQYNLARDLIYKVARIDAAAISDLAEALERGDEGLVNGIVEQINQRLAATLNFPKWWVQDRDFQLIVSPRDDDLVFTIRDRTHTQYSFGERSNGLKYFLSYYIQYLAHEPPAEGHEILLMDEPDAFLSSQGQQDLLKIFSSFAHPEVERRPVQVIYVTHSPFLIDRNHAERIRVLEKGTDDEGTRVVNDASKNHYEPLRSSFGAYLGETAFIGNCNIMVEGLADQVFLAGCTTYLRSVETPRMNTLDLNRVTLVPAGSASHIPYLVYLARGRDVEQPSVIVLLDDDKAGKEALKGLQRGGANKKQLLKREYILSISSLSDKTVLPQEKRLVETEDLIPPQVAACATHWYLRTVCGMASEVAAQVTAQEIETHWTGDACLFDAVAKIVAGRFGENAHVDKLGFARAVIEVIQRHVVNKEFPELVASVPIFTRNVTALLSQLAAMQRKAERETTQERITRRIDRSIKSFSRDHSQSARREDAIVLLEEIESVLDDSLEADQVRLRLQSLRREHDLNEAKPGFVENFASFAAGLDRVRYAPLNAVQQETPDFTQALQSPSGVGHSDGSQSTPSNLSAVAPESNST